MKALLHAIEKWEWTHNGFRSALGEKNVDSFIPTRLRNTKYIAGNADYSNEHFMDQLDDYDLIVLRSWFSFVDPNFKKLLNYNTSAPKILLDYEDSYFIHSIYRSKQITLYFKRELIKEKIGLWASIQWLPAQFARTTFISPLFFHKNPIDMINLTPALFSMGSKLRPYPVTTIPDPNIKGKTDRDIDLSMMMTLSHRERRNTFNYVNKMSASYKDRKFVLSSGSGIPKKKYLETIASSKAGISVRGMGYDAFRYWEIPCYGAALFSKKTPMAIQNDFTEDESALFFSTNDELRSKFDKYVVNSDEWKEIAKAGQDQFFKYHTPEKRIENLILSELRKL